MTAEVEGEIETENKVLIIRRIRVTYHLKAPESARETAERVHRVHHQSCPVYMSLHKAIDISTELRIEVEWGQSSAGRGETDSVSPPRSTT